MKTQCFERARIYTFCLLVALICLSGSRIQAANPPPSGNVAFYVALTGSDTNPGTQSSPVRTIQKGINLANDAINNNNVDVIVHIKAGRYEEVASIESVANTARTLTLEGESGTVLTGADQWHTGWTLNTNGTYVHSWPYKWGAQSLPDGWADYWNWDGKGFIRDRVLRREMIYINDTGLCGRLNLSELSAPVRSMWMKQTR